MRDLIAADNACDLERVLSLYAKDVVWLPPMGAPVTGRDAIAVRYRALFRDYQPQFTVEIAESRRDGGLAYVRGLVRGELRPRVGGTPLPVADKFLAILVGGGHGWQVTHLAWSPTAAENARE